MRSEYVQYGCGWSAPETWLNYDSSATLRFERLPILGRLYTKNSRRFPGNVQYGDIVEGLPVQHGSCRGIYCSHVLEHLALEEFGVALRNTHQYLAPGGIFRLVLPDLEFLARSYLAGMDADAASRFMEASGLGRRRRARGLLSFVAEWLSSGAHLWMWDEASMKQQLAEKGFRDIRRAHFGDSEDPRFSEVEDQGRFADCLAMQCRK